MKIYNEISLTENFEIKAEGIVLNIPNIIVESVLGTGANGKVFKAKDVRLNRSIAVKVWKKKVNLNKAEKEIAKLAQIENTLFVRVYDFFIDNNIAICKMEHVDGIDGKAFLLSNNIFEDRLRLWILYSCGLKKLYRRDIHHGDPHLGNVFITPMLDDLPYHCLPDELKENASFSIKIGDTGTSLLWDVHDKFIEREKSILVETFCKIFNIYKIDDILYLPENLDAKQTLNVLDSYSLILWALECNKLTKGINNQDIQNIHGLIVRAVTYAPFYNLDKLGEITVENTLWGKKHLFRRISNHFGYDNDCFYDDPFTFDFMPELKSKYNVLKSALFLKKDGKVDYIWR